MFGLLITVHVITCLLLIFIVLLQSGKGAELGAAFGGMGQASTVRGVATFLNKFTTVLAIVFMLTSLGLALMSTEKAKSSATDAQPITSTNSTNSVEDKTETSSTSQEKTK